MITLSSTTNKDLMTQARASLSGKWGLAMGTYVVFMLISMGISQIPALGQILNMLISGPMAIGFAIFALALSRKQEAK